METLLVGADQTDAAAAPAGARESSPMRTVNAAMREGARAFSRSEPIAFFWECHDPICFSAAWMSQDVFDATVAGHRGWMLFDGHEPSTLWHTRELPPAPARPTVETRGVNANDPRKSLNLRPTRHRPLPNPRKPKSS